MCAVTHTADTCGDL